MEIGRSNLRATRREATNHHPMLVGWHFMMKRVLKREKQVTLLWK